MAQAPAPERTVVINGSGGGSNGGMGMGLVLGAILVIVLAIAIGWFFMADRGMTMPDVNVSPTINLPDIKVPDTITINPAQSAPQRAP